MWKDQDNQSRVVILGNPGLVLDNHGKTSSIWPRSSSPAGSSAWFVAAWPFLHDLPLGHFSLPHISGQAARTQEIIDSGSALGATISLRDGRIFTMDFKDIDG